MQNAHTPLGTANAISEPISIVHVAAEVRAARELMRCDDLAPDACYIVEDASAFGRVLELANRHLDAAIGMIEIISTADRAGAGEAGQ